MMRWAKGRGIIDRNPLEGFEVPAAAPSRDRVLNDHELKLVWTASEELGRYFATRPALLLTGQRRTAGSPGWSGKNWIEAGQEVDTAFGPGKEWQEAPYSLSQQVIAELDALAEALARKKALS